MVDKDTCTIARQGETLTIMSRVLDGLPPEPPSSEITPEPLYLRRREFLKGGALATATAVVVAGGLAELMHQSPPPDPPPAPPPGSVAVSLGVPVPALSSRGPYDTTEKMTSFQDVTTYNNFYEFGINKGDPARNAGTLRPRPWSITVGGETNQPQVIDIDTLLHWFPLEQRIYRMRCVEAWSMVIPWLGFPLAPLIKKLEPLGSAAYVKFLTLMDPKQMPGENDPILQWPYIEGLRMDEAMNPLTFLAVGLYGRPLPNQDGAPIRLVVPWKYGFKGIKSIVNISFERQQPANTWAVAAPNEYGFYANVNPHVDHPRWSQATERRIGELRPRPTLMFNGYSEQVASLYTGMDLRKYF